MAVPGDDTKPIAVAVKRQPQLGVTGLQRLNQVTEIFRFAGVGVMVRKVAVDFAKQLRHLTT